ncbi:MAG TPA: LPS export ABC transporter periplasmic protein LptC [Gammaproteobacteria bacterium]|jgi:lipopolysaccharide export system protein LptC
MSRRWILFLSLVGIAVLSGWLLQRLDQEPAARPQAGRHLPDYYVENFTSTTMDESGLPHRRVSADYMAHFPDTDTHELSRPYMVLYRESSMPWHVRAERGWISSNGDVLLLLGKVHIWRNNSAGERQMDIRTEDLRVLPDTNYGETDKLAIITTPGTESRGVGMRAFLDRSRVELLSQVHTLYDPVSK